MEKMRKINSNAGYTLVELLMVVGIIGILTAMISWSAILTLGCTKKLHTLLDFVNFVFN